MWPEAIKEIASLLKKWGGAIFAFLAGRKSGKESARKKQRKTHDKAEAEQDEKDRELEALDRDDNLTERMRAVRKRNAASGGDVQG